MTCSIFSVTTIAPAASSPAPAPTVAEARTPLYLLIDLALGAGWPIDQTPNPSIMLVDYVRAYRQRP